MQISASLIRAMSKMGQHRAFCGIGLEEVMKTHENVYVVTADLACYSGLGRLFRTRPDRMINVGIQEQGMTGIASGMALEGAVVYTVTYAAFALARSMEQIRNNLSVLGANVKVVGMCAGYSMESLGRSHWATEDLAMARCLPNVAVFSPADSLEAVKVCTFLADRQGPAYVRLSYVSDCPVVYAEDYPFLPGRAVTLRDGSEAVLAATGAMVAESLAAAKLLEKQGISVTVVNFHTIKPFDPEPILTAARLGIPVFTVEEHNIIGGLGSAAAECLAGAGGGAPLYRLGMQDRHYLLGKREFIWKQAGLCREQIAAYVQTVLTGK